MIAGAASSGHVYAERPLGIPAVVEILRKLWPGAKIRVRGGVTVTCDSVTYHIRPNTQPMFEMIGCDGANKWAVRVRVAGDVVEREMTKNGTVIYAEHNAAGVPILRALYDGVTLASVRYSGGRAMQMSLMKTTESTVTDYFPACSCGKDHVEKITHTVFGRNGTRNVKVYAEPDEIERLVSEYNYLKESDRGDDWRQHGLCSDYYPDLTIIEEYNMGRIIRRTTSFAEAPGVLHDETFEQK